MVQGYHHDSWSDQGANQTSHAEGPLGLDGGSAEVEELGKAIAYDVPNIIFDAENPLGEVIDPETGSRLLSGAL